LPFVCSADDSLAANNQQMSGYIDGMRVFIPTDVHLSAAAKD
jgi:hypothetical protein